MLTPCTYPHLAILRVRRSLTVCCNSELDATEKEIKSRVLIDSLDYLCCATVGQPQLVDIQEQVDWPDSAVINYNLPLARRL